MIIRMESRSPCPVCGHHNRHLTFGVQVRVNKNSVRPGRSDRPHLAFQVDSPCPECGCNDPTTRLRERCWPDRDSAAKITAERARKWGAT